ERTYFAPWLADDGDAAQTGAKWKGASRKQILEQLVQRVASGQSPDGSGDSPKSMSKSSRRFQLAKPPTQSVVLADSCLSVMISSTILDTIPLLLSDIWSAEVSGVRVEKDADKEDSPKYIVALAPRQETGDISMRTNSSNSAKDATVAK
ncbi:unnamed protein product, partial [Polarella glacialis]